MTLGRTRRFATRIGRGSRVDARSARHGAAERDGKILRRSPRLLGRHTKVIELAGRAAGRSSARSIKAGS